MNANNHEIDLVVMWVDGSDSAWQAEKSKYAPNNNSDGSIYRYRDWGLLKYWFRGVETFAPWVNRIYFVTWGHVPKWLNIHHPKLKIIKHEDFIPPEYLPTFSANTIESNIHRIRGLSEKFILMNDDLYFINNTKPSDFFANSVPKDTVALNVHCPKKSLISQYFCINDTNIINEHFDFKKSIKDNLWKWLDPKNGINALRTITLLPCPRFPGFWQHHLANAYLKSTFKTVWEKEPEILKQTCSNKFRQTTDVNQWVFREWQIAAGDFKVRSHKFGKSFYIDRDGIDALQPKIIKYIRKQQGRMVAINDGEMDDEAFQNLLTNLHSSFQYILPHKSAFEK